jgi:hypothetical protein
MFLNLLKAFNSNNKNNYQIIDVEVLSFECSVF